MGLNEGQSGTDSRLESLTLEAVIKKSVLIFSAQEIESLLRHQAYLTDHFFMLPPLSAEIQSVGDFAVIVYFKDEADNFKEATFNLEAGAGLDPGELAAKLNEIGFNILSHNVQLFGMPAQEVKYMLREKKFRRDNASR